MSKVIKIRKGLNIKLKGEAEKVVKKSEAPKTYALKPTDFFGLKPKLKVKLKQKVKAGTTVFFRKQNPEIKFTSPVSGTVKAINRGKRRRILEIVIEADSENKYKVFKRANPLDMDAESIRALLLESGIWPSIQQRPYGTIAVPSDSPKAIFISAFDTAPLAPDLNFVIEKDAEAFQTGLNALSKLTNGKVHLNITAKSSVSKVLLEARNVQINKFCGPHPAGNTGTQIHFIDAINKNEIVWTVRPHDVIIMGRLFLSGKYDARKIVALTGSEVINPSYFESRVGAGLYPMLKRNLKDDSKIRIISGNVLTGEKVLEKGYLSYYDSQVTVIPEGDDYEFFGWAKPGLQKFSVSHSFFSWLTPGKHYRLNANMNGEKRAFVLSNQYEKVMPMDILPVFLLKAILAEDIDKMEQLGIYEVVPEDFALCEFVCTSKINSQDIIQQGINLMIKELS